MGMAADASTIALADRLARAVVSGKGQQVLRLFASLTGQASGPSAGRSTAASKPPAEDGMRAGAESDDAPAAPLSERIGIWRRADAGGRIEWQRHGDPETWRFWADVPRLTLAPDRRRVVLFGESVARGFFYDPAYTPAIALSQMLASHVATRDVDVVDLARVDCSRRLLLELVAASRALAPACWIVFAGNNWSPYPHFDAQQFEGLAQRIGSAAGWDAVRDYVEAICREHVDAFVRRLATLSADAGVPVVIVIPEFNLAGWRNEYGTSTPLVSGADARQWAELHRSAATALAAGDWARATALAQAMRAIDGGGTPRTSEILADCCRWRGARDEARDWLERAKDAELTVPVRRSPRCFSIVQQTLRESAVRAGIATVDLPARFRELQHGDLPDGRLFHDYCHLTIDGIREAMALTAERVLSLLQAPARSWRELHEVEPGVAPSTIAEACFLAALHNAAWDQPYETIRRQCRDALARWPDIHHTMTRAIDFHVRRAPAVLCRSFEVLARSTTVSAVNFLSFSSDPTREKLLNPSLVRAVTEALADRTPEPARALDALLISEHDVAAGPTDLLATPYHCSSAADPAFRWRQHHGFFKAYAASSVFRFMASHAYPLSLRITWRVPRATRGGELPLFVNDVHIAALHAASEWRAATICIGREHVRTGANEVRIEWPVGTWSVAAHLQSLATSLQHGDRPDIFPVWGELYALDVRLDGAPLAASS
jgi:hypothetical protein